MCAETSVASITPLLQTEKIATKENTLASVAVAAGMPRNRGHPLWSEFVLLRLVYSIRWQIEAEGKCTFRLPADSLRRLGLLSRQASELRLSSWYFGMRLRYQPSSG